jgi:hypothetical protein
MATTLHTLYGVEIMGREGPTGEFREVLEMRLEDYGGNVLQEGKAGSWAFDHCKWRIPVRRVATKLGVEIASAEYLCDFSAV